MLEKARNEMGELGYMVPVKELTGTVTFRHLLRFSQKGNSFCLLLVMCVPMHLHSKVLRRERMDRDAGEISELVQNRLAIGVGNSANACGGDAVTTGAAGAQHDQLYQLSSSGVTKVSVLPDTLTTPLGSLWKLYIYARLEDTHQPEQPYQCRGNSPEEVYCCQAGRA